MPTNPARSFPHLWCGSCARTAECTRADRLEYALNGWPRCCGEVMELFMHSERDSGKDADSFKLNPGGQRA